MGMIVPHKLSARSELSEKFSEIANAAGFRARFKRPLPVFVLLLAALLALLLYPLAVLFLLPQTKVRVVVALGGAATAVIITVTVTTVVAVTAIVPIATIVISAIVAATGSAALVRRLWALEILVEPEAVKLPALVVILWDLLALVLEVLQTLRAVFATKKLVRFVPKFVLLVGISAFVSLILSWHELPVVASVG